MPFLDRVVRDDIEAEDDLESYFNYIKNAPVASFDDEEELEYDSDGNPIVPEKSKVFMSNFVRNILFIMLNYFFEKSYIHVHVHCSRGKNCRTLKLIYQIIITTRQ